MAWLNTQGLCLIPSPRPLAFIPQTYPNPWRAARKGCGHVKVGHLRRKRGGGSRSTHMGPRARAATILRVPKARCIVGRALLGLESVDPCRGSRHCKSRWRRGELTQRPQNPVYHPNPTKSAQAPEMWHRLVHEAWGHRVCVWVCVLVTESCPTLCDPMGWSPPGSSVHGILQARILEWVAFPFSRVSSQPRDWTWVPTLQVDSLLSEPPGKPRGHRVGMSFFPLWI